MSSRSRQATCIVGWNKVNAPCLLPRNPAIYDDLADMLDQAVPETSLRVRVRCLIARRGISHCVLEHGDGVVWMPVSFDRTVIPVDRMMLALCRSSSYPAHTAWCGLAILYDMLSGSMEACLRYGYDTMTGPVARPSSRDVLFEDPAPPAIMSLIRAAS